MSAAHLGRRAVLGLAAGLGAGLLAACSDPNSIAAQAQSGDRKGYIAGDGSIERLATDQRKSPITVSGTLLDGSAWSSSTALGRVLVINVWGSWCPPCVEETPDLEKVYKATRSAGTAVDFVGINVRESQATAIAFARDTMTYPSISNDASGGTPMLTLGSLAASTPCTILLDQSGRVAARVLGSVSAATLQGLIDDTVAGAA